MHLKESQIRSNLQYLFMYALKTVFLGCKAFQGIKVN